MKSPDIGIKSNTKTAMIALLNARLADSIDLSLAVKQAHWNLKGPTFIAVHELLDQLRANLDTNTDTVAERVAQLDGVALGTTQTVGDKSELPAYPTDIRKVADHVGALVEGYAVLVLDLRPISGDFMWGGPGKLTLNGRKTLSPAGRFRLEQKGADPAVHAFFNSVRLFRSGGEAVRWHGAGCS